ncbi:MAG: hypothetical protein IT184_18570 [Acidobacteria bacterium]|nr:hypothetical protein [Acidobacteriota bacterium]
MSARSALRRFVGGPARQAARLVVDLCRELSDERAYERHLAAHRTAHSPDEWRRFCDERLKARFARGRCC